MNPSDFMQYVRQGWPVLPIQPGTKCIRWDLLEHPVADYFANPTRADEIVRWAAAGATVAVALKGAGLAVLDIDERDLGHAWIEENGGWPETPRVRTPNGWHVYFKATDAMYAGVVEVDGEKLADFLVDRQCYVLAPPTPGYEWEIGLEAPLADAPTWALCAVIRKLPDSWLWRELDDDESDEWQYDIEEAEARFCPFGGVGQYAPGCEDCDFCQIGELCKEITEKRFAAEAGAKESDSEMHEAGVSHA